MRRAPRSRLKVAVSNSSGRASWCASQCSTTSVVTLHSPSTALSYHIRATDGSRSSSSATLVAPTASARAVSSGGGCSIVLSTAPLSESASHASL